MTNKANRNLHPRAEELGDAIRSRLDELGRSTNIAVSLGKLSRATFLDYKNGLATAGVQGATLDGIDRALDWREGHSRSILNGETGQEVASRRGTHDLRMLGEMLEELQGAMERITEGIWSVHQHPKTPPEVKIISSSALQEALGAQQDVAREIEQLRPTPR